LEGFVSVNVTRDRVREHGGPRTPEAWLMWRERCRRLVADEDGPTAVEYAIILALILVVLIFSITAVGNSTSGLWQSDSDQISKATSGS
jgi:pilus assembly protein Flp/PilA